MNRKGIQSAGSRVAFLIGWVRSVLVVLFMGVMPLAMYFLNRDMFLKGLTDHGYPQRLGVVILTIEVVCVLIYAIPRTAGLGAILLTGYLGGAVATHVRVGETNWVVAVVCGVVIWLSLLLRDKHLRLVLPFRR